MDFALLLVDIMNESSNFLWKYDRNLQYKFLKLFCPKVCANFSLLVVHTKELMNLVWSNGS
jgi:hypothetical protein